jgi:hypothetical protein
MQDKFKKKPDLIEDRKTFFHSFVAGFQGQAARAA